MVTRSGPHRARARPSAPALRTGLLTGLAAALLALCLLAAAAPPAAAQSGTLYFLTLKRGVMEPSGDDLFTQLAAAHGALNESRQSAVTGIELDIYGVTRGNAGLGIGIELQQYDRDFNFLGDGENLHIRGKGVLFTIKSFLRLGNVYPFVGAGIGNYYLIYDQDPSGSSFRDSPDSVANVRAGVRFLLGRFGLLYEVGITRAPIGVQTDIGTARLELGGTYSNVGVSWLF